MRVRVPEKAPPDDFQASHLSGTAAAFEAASPRWHRFSPSRPTVSIRSQFPGSVARSAPARPEDRVPRELLDQAKAKSYRLRDMVLDLVESESFAER